MRQGDEDAPDSEPVGRVLHGAAEDEARRAGGARDLDVEKTAGRDPALQGLEERFLGGESRREVPGGAVFPLAVGDLGLG